MSLVSESDWKYRSSDKIVDCTLFIFCQIIVVHLYTIIENIKTEQNYLQFDLKQLSIKTIRWILSGIFINSIWLQLAIKIECIKKS